jgi:hypothetical protein
MNGSRSWRSWRNGACVSFHREIPESLSALVVADATCCVPFSSQSDPFVELHWQSGHGTKKHSSTHEKTVNPVWNEEFEFQVENELTDILEVSVYDRNKISTNELLGVCEVPVAMVVTAAGPVTAGFPLHERHHPNKHTKGQLHLKLVCVQERRAALV